MKRWLLAGLLGIAVLIFLTPGIIGMLAERSLRQQLEQDSHRGPDYAVRELDFARSWFTSAGRHRLPIADATLARLIALLTPGTGATTDALALIIDTRLEHGLVPLGSAPRDASSLIPALATGVSTLTIELPNGDELPMPGVLYSRIGLTGSAGFRYELPAGDRTPDKLQFTWQATDLSLNSNSSGRELAFAANLPGMRFANDWQKLEFSNARISVSSRQTPWGFAIGDATLRLAAARSAFHDLENRLDSFELDASSAMQGTEVQGNLRFSAQGIARPDGVYDLELATANASANGELLGPVVRGLRYSATSQQIISGEIYPGFEEDLRRLLSAGATLAVEELQLRTPDGGAVVSFALQAPGLDDVASWPGLLLALSANADIVIERRRVDAPSPLSDQLRMLVAGGFLVLDGDVYRMRAEYASGKATVNGAPLVIPMEMLR